MVAVICLGDRRNLEGSFLVLRAPLQASGTAFIWQALNSQRIKACLEFLRSYCCDWYIEEKFFSPNETQSCKERERFPKDVSVNMQTGTLASRWRRKIWDRFC